MNAMQTLSTSSIKTINGTVYSDVASLQAEIKRLSTIKNRHLSKITNGQATEQTMIVLKTVHTQYEDALEALEYLSN